MKLTFDRSEYLENEDIFESDKIDYVDSELCEFNNDAEDMAYELAYTRYALAKAEAQVSNIRLGLEKMGSIITGKSHYLGYQEGEFCIFRIDGEGVASAPTLAGLLDQVALMEVE